MTEQPTKLCAILGGGDWYDASVEHLVVPAEVDLEQEKKQREEWYRAVYLPSLKAGNPVKFMSLTQWLIDRYQARAPEDHELEVFDDRL